MTNPVLVEVERSGFVESRHRGAVAVLGTDGAARTLGAAGEPIFPRSANKPVQAVAMLRAGLDLAGSDLALAAGSHSGEEFHVAGVASILAGAGLTTAALRCPQQWPMEQAVALELARAGGGPARIRMNCSGKHAAMLATCVINGWSTADYLDAGHPLQRAIAAAVADLTGERPAAVGVDGCGAPLFAVSLTGVARAFRTLVTADPGTPERRVADAMRAHPEWTSGTRREERRLMAAVPGLLLKCGAEGVDAFALADGRAAALKADDGSMRARTPLTVALLGALRVPVEDPAVLAELAATPLTGGDAVVGAIRPVPGVLSGVCAGARARHGDGG